MLHPWPKCCYAAHDCIKNLKPFFKSRDPGVPLVEHYRVTEDKTSKREWTQNFPHMKPFSLLIVRGWCFNWVSTLTLESDFHPWIQSLKYLAWLWPFTVDIQLSLFWHFKIRHSYHRLVLTTLPWIRWKSSRYRTSSKSVTACEYFLNTCSSLSIIFIWLMQIVA